MGHTALGQLTPAGSTKAFFRKPFLINERLIKALGGSDPRTWATVVYADTLDEDDDDDDVKRDVDTLF